MKKLLESLSIKDHAYDKKIEAAEKELAQLEEKLKLIVSAS